MDMEERLYEAAIAGDVKILDKLLQEDSCILDKAVLKCLDNNRTPLHIAVMLGHANFAKEISKVCSDMCLTRDGNGRNPLHLAAIKGKGEVLQVLLKAGHSSAAREKIDNGGTILHLCVKYNQLEMLKILLQFFKDSEFLNAMNNEGMTVLHLAVLYQQIETIKYLEKTNILVNTMNAKGKTALDIARNLSSEMAIINILRRFGASKGSVIAPAPWESLNKVTKKFMITAALIATFTFQAGLNPPGGVWQEDSDPLGSTNHNATMTKRLHKAGEAVMAYNNPNYYAGFLAINTFAFAFSLTIVLWSSPGILWLIVIPVAASYLISIKLITPKDYQNKLNVVIALFAVGVCLTGILVLPLVIMIRHKEKIRARVPRPVSV